MIKIDYSFRALQPIHTGSDESFGTEKKLNREKVILRNPIEIKSEFKSEVERRESIIKILHAIWKCIDFEDMKKMRLMKIWDEFTSKLIVSTGVQTKYQFLNTLCTKFGIRSVSDTKVIAELDRFSDDELLETIREEYQYLSLLLRKETKKKDISTLPLFTEKNNSVNNLIFKKYFDTVPVVSGNSIRGMLRRLLMHDFCKRADINKLDKNTYHQLFTGGNITDSSSYENIEKREKFISACPPIGLLGAAIGNMTIEGELNVGGARLKCKEYSTGELSYWELINTIFGTRLDSSKTEKDIEIISDEKAKQTTQMKYEFEVFIVGSQFNHSFVFKSDNKLLESCFYHMLTLFKEMPYICGISARGLGRIDLSDLDFDIKKTELYLQYLKDNKESIQEYFKS